MAQMQALLKIKADVQGSGAVDALGRSIGGLGSAAGKVSGGLKGLAGAAGGLGGALGALVPAASVAGLAALAKGAIDTADDFAKMSAKTGASVEQLSKFKQAADLGGSSIEEVGNSMLKLNRALGTGEGPAIEALKTLGINANDANGKLKSTDAIMLEVADKFKAMPDGANKSALAMQLFGKSGANMIPMLNGGSKAIDGLNATMSTKFAKAAEVFNDRITTIQAKLMELGVQLADVLMPVFNGLMSLIETIVSGISKLPGPIQAIILSVVALTAVLVILAPAISAVISIAGVLAGLKIGATIAGWAALAGPAIAAISAAFTGLLTFLTGTLLPGLIAFFSGPVGWTVLAVAAVVAMVVLFREPIGRFFTWLGGAISTAFSGLMAALYPIFVQPFIDLWNNVLKGPVTTFFSWIGGYIQFSMKTAYALAYQVFVQPWINVWNTLKGPVTTFFSWIGGVVKAGMDAALKLAYAVWVKPWLDLWNNVLRKPVTDGIKWIQNVWKGITKFFSDNVTTPISKAWTAMVEFLPKTMNTIGDKVKNIFTGVVNTIKGALRSVLQFIANAVNSVGAQVNKLIGAFNRLPGPDIPFVPTLSVPQFAKGGYVGQGTLAVVGEAGPEYIIPASKMAAASANYLSGARGGAVIPAFANGGFVGSARSTVVASPATGGSNAQINVTTGPVMQMDNELYVTLADLERAMRMTADSVYASLRTAAGRYAMGTR
jgi:hypothetical protein